MPLKDSFSRQPDSNAQVPSAPKPDKLPRPPSKEDLEFTLQRARDKPNVAIGLQWTVGELPFVLSITAGEGKTPPAWSLQSGTGADRTVAWSYKSYDVAQILNRIETTMQNPQAAIESEPQEIFPGQEEEPTNKLVGEKFADQYIIIDEIGEGGMGMVYKARDLQADRFVAVKVLHKRLLSEPTSKKRFEQEARAAMTLAHPNLIMVYHYGFYETTIPFLVMEYIDGRGLDEKLKVDGQLSILDCLDLFIQCCDGLTYAHQKKIIHRDLKPSNVMVLKGGKSIKIVDFGISKILAKELTRQDLTQEDQLIGSPYYMSPEQCKGEKIDARSDIYSLGCLMYHAVTGVVPFAGENALQTMGKHICESPASLMGLRPDLHIPVKLQSCILTCLEKEPDDRFQDLSEVKEQLLEILDELRGPQPKDVAPAPTHLLVVSGELPASTYEAALKVQSLLRSGAMTLTQAAEALERAHLQGGLIATDHASGEESTPKGIETPVEAILVEAGLIRNDVWKTVLQLQLQMRTGKLSKEAALDEFRRLHPKTVAVEEPKPKPKPQPIPIPKDILALMVSAGIISKQEVDAAAAEHGEEGTQLAKRLVAMGKLDDDTLIAARQCLSLIEHKGLAMERAVIALNYRQRSRVNLYQVFDDLGWDRP